MPKESFRLYLDNKYQFEFKNSLNPGKHSSPRSPASKGYLFELEEIKHKNRCKPFQELSFKK